MHENRLEKICINLVKENILGTRLSNDTPKYIHSLRVYELLKNERCKFPTQIAGLLHDILEDSNISREELRELGVPEVSVQLVELVTHDSSQPSTISQWESKMKKLIASNNREAWTIAVADMIDNMREPLFLEDEKKLRRYLSSKVAVILYYAAKYLRNTPIFELFLQEYINLVQKANKYDFIVTTRQK